MTSENAIQRDVLLRALQDVLNDVAQQIDKIPKPECQDCPVYKGLGIFASKLRKAGIQEETEIIQEVREYYNI